MPRATRLVPIFAGVLFAGCTAVAPCVLPAPDGQDTSPSSPALSGTISRIAADTVTIQPTGAGAGEPGVVVKVSADTKLFTDFGGFVPRDRLTLGSQAEVWLLGCKAPAADAENDAAVIRVDRRQ